MRIKVLPGDFVVEEQAHLALAPSGLWAVYRVRKVNLGTLDVQTRLAAALKLPRDRVVFPALKDKEAVATQFATLPAGQPEVIEGEGFRAQRAGYRLRPLNVADLAGNAFIITLRDLGRDEATHLAQRLVEMGRGGLPNYFDEQRFGSLAEEGFIGKAILRRDAEGALRAYLTQAFAGDPRPVRAFKREAASLWPDWAAMFAAAPRPSNYRSVLTFLIGHPQEYRRAINLVPQRLLSLYLAAYQSFLWNRLAADYLAQFYAAQGARVAHLEIAGQRLPVHTALADSAATSLGGLQIPLPNHRAVYRPQELAEMVTAVLAEEGLALDDLKARILQKAYLPKGARPTLLLPGEVSVEAPAEDVHFPGRLSLRTHFLLPRGAYATLVLKCAALP